MAPTLADLDDRAKHWPFLLRWTYWLVKGTLVALGAYILIGHYVLTWGVSAAAWFLIVPLLYGIWQGWTTAPPPRGSSRSGSR